MTTPAHERGRKLIQLYRRGVGGERENAGRLLATHLRAHDLTLYDLDPSLPVSQDVRALEAWRESAALLVKLGTPEQDEVLTQLVDAEDLTQAELERVLAATDLEKLVRLRAEGWAYSDALEAADFERAGQGLTPAEVLPHAGPLAERVRAALRERHGALTRPQRLLRAANPLTAHLFLGFVESVGGRGARLTEDGVSVRLSPDQLARVRTLMATYGEGLTQQALRQAEALALEKGREHP
ncbi:hypothetical protein [Deinococcus hopiensis]|uniref:Uncharacterized protein n=1 Tax=Deinococcus hopiensis KR-140 TaxID=695939 RepID=A0A1W1V5J2_9DEIO|nr:hypothetical protein [Deinococcus hopiensis]SMB88420.1 hypothetical protein SAMN00790413_00039 [Deinococcus hopiensis KR-140]